MITFLYLPLGWAWPVQSQTSGSLPSRHRRRGEERFAAVSSRHTSSRHLDQVHLREDRNRQVLQPRANLHVHSGDFFFTFKRSLVIDFEIFYSMHTKLFSFCCRCCKGLWTSRWVECPTLATVFPRCPPWIDTFRLPELGSGSWHAAWVCSR